jgi:solute carrier family 25 aspartate/glutamate transporter 12/13
MKNVPTVKEVVKESLLGSEQAGEEQLSAQSKATFEKNARKDEATGEWYMGEEDFIRAIAPEGEDYVSQLFYPLSTDTFGAIG